MTSEQIINGFLSFLAAKKLNHLLPEIVSKLSRFVEEQKETAYITSAVSLSSEESFRLAEFLKKEFGRALKVQLTIDPQILGGLKIMVGDQMIDQTVVSKLSSIIEKIED